MRKQSARKGRHRCSLDGCRRLAVAGGELCQPCLDARDLRELQEVDPGARRIDTLDGLRFAKLDTEMRNHMQGIRIADLEIAALNVSKAQQIQQLRESLDSQIRQKENQRKQLTADMNALRPRYDALIVELAERYGVDKRKMTIDADVGLIRELE